MGIHPQAGREADDFDIDRVWELLEPWLTPKDVEVIRYPVYQFVESMTDQWQAGRIFLVTPPRSPGA